MRQMIQFAHGHNAENRILSDNALSDLPSALFETLLDLTIMSESYTIEMKATTGLSSNLNCIYI